MALDRQGHPRQGVIVKNLKITPCFSKLLEYVQKTPRGCRHEEDRSFSPEIQPDGSVYGIAAFEGIDRAFCKVR